MCFEDVVLNITIFCALLSSLRWLTNMHQERKSLFILWILWFCCALRMKMDDMIMCFFCLNLSSCDTPFF